ncbi:2277_t:CDS:1, partial [Rhizophagus irregularis]
SRSQAFLNMNSQGQFSDSESNQNLLISTAFNPQDTPVSFHERQESSIALSEMQPPDSQPQPTVTNTYVQPDSSANLRTQPVHPTDFFFRPPNDYYHYHVI